jgi:hypothetical protein
MFHKTISAVAEKCKPFRDFTSRCTWLSLSRIRRCPPGMAMLLTGSLPLHPGAGRPREVAPGGKSAVVFGRLQRQKQKRLARWILWRCMHGEILARTSAHALDATTRLPSARPLRAIGTGGCTANLCAAGGGRQTQEHRSARRCDYPRRGTVTHGDARNASGDQGGEEDPYVARSAATVSVSRIQACFSFLRFGEAKLVT